MKNQVNVRFAVLLLITACAGIWRIFLSTGHSSISNFNPIGAMALFGGAYFIQRWKGLLFPLLALFISDVVMMKTIYASSSNGLLYEGWWIVYGAFSLVVLMGSYILKKISVKNFLIAAVSAALLHWIITDFGVWVSGSDITTGKPFTQDWRGLVKCYTLALPYMKNMIIGNLVYGTILFGGFELVQKRFPVLKVKMV